MMLLLWSTVSYLELQRSMRWWFERRAAHLDAQSERIHNGVMQELFVLRRDLEAALEQGKPIAAHQNQSQLQAIENIHCQLEQISNELSPPYISDSFPLAIRSYLQDCQRIHAHRLELKLPATWGHEAAIQSQIMLMALNELLQIALPLGQAKLACCVRLKAPSQEAKNVEHQQQLGELSVEVTYPNAALISTILQTKELRYLRRVVRGLACGRLFYQRSHLTVTWYFHWSLRSPVSLTVRED